MSPTLELTLVEIWAWQWGQVIATGAEPNTGGGDNCCCCITTGGAATPPAAAAAGDVSITVEVVGFSSENNNTPMNCQSRVEHQHSYPYTKISKNTESKDKACCCTAGLNMNFRASSKEFWFWQLSQNTFSHSLVWLKPSLQAGQSPAGDKLAITKKFQEHIHAMRAKVEMRILSFDSQMFHSGSI